jgi:hypothetical protein
MMTEDLPCKRQCRTRNESLPFQGQWQVNGSTTTHTMHLPPIDKTTSQGMVINHVKTSLRQLGIARQWQLFLQHPQLLVQFFTLVDSNVMKLVCWDTAMNLTLNLTPGVSITNSIPNLEALDTFYWKSGVKPYLTEKDPEYSHFIKLHQEWVVEVSSDSNPSLTHLTIDPYQELCKSLFLRGHNRMNADNTWKRIISFINHKDIRTCVRDPIPYLNWAWTQQYLREKYILNYTEWELLVGDGRLSVLKWIEMNVLPRYKDQISIFQGVICCGVERKSQHPSEDAYLNLLIEFLNPQSLDVYISEPRSSSQTSQRKYSDHIKSIYVAILRICIFANSSYGMALMHTLAVKPFMSITSVNEGSTAEQERLLDAQIPTNIRNVLTHLNSQMDCPGVGFRCITEPVTLYRAAVSVKNRPALELLVSSIFKRMLWTSNDLKAMYHHHVMTKTWALAPLRVRLADQKPSEDILYYGKDDEDFLQEHLESDYLTKGPLFVMIIATHLAMKLNVRIDLLQQLTRSLLVENHDDDDDDIKLHNDSDIMTMDKDTIITQTFECVKILAKQSPRNFEPLQSDPRWECPLLIERLCHCNDFIFPVQWRRSFYLDALRFHHLDWVPVITLEKEQAELRTLFRRVQPAIWVQEKLYLQLCRRQDLHDLLDTNLWTEIINHLFQAGDVGGLEWIMQHSCEYCSLTTIVPSPSQVKVNEEEESTSITLDQKQVKLKVGQHIIQMGFFENSSLLNVNYNFKKANNALIHWLHTYSPFRFWNFFHRSHFDDNGTASRELLTLYPEADAYLDYKQWVHETYFIGHSFKVCE